VGTSTQEHYHAKTEEIYFITAGRGRMRIDGEVSEVKAGEPIAHSAGQKAQALKHWRRTTDAPLLLRAMLRAQRHVHHES